MFKLQYMMSLALHWLCRASGLERLVLWFSSSRAAAYLRAQGLSELLESDLALNRAIPGIPA